LHSRPRDRTLRLGLGQALPVGRKPTRRLCHADKSDSRGVGHSPHRVDVGRVRILERLRQAGSRAAAGTRPGGGGAVPDRQDAAGAEMGRRRRRVVP
jgi:hypothetical protein